MKSERKYLLGLIGAAAASTVLTLGVAACSTTPDDRPESETAGGSKSPAETTTTSQTEDMSGALQPQKIWEREHQLNNGETVTCLYVQDAGLSCDWAGAVDYGGQK